LPLALLPLTFSIQYTKKTEKSYSYPNLEPKYLDINLKSAEHPCALLVGGTVEMPSKYMMKLMPIPTLLLLPLLPVFLLQSPDVLDLYK
jgi:hypothetical protein